MSKKILDFGCGRGFRAPVLGLLGEYWGVDILLDNIEQAKHDFPDKNFVLIDNQTLPFADNYFDQIFAYEVLEHASDLPAVLGEIKRCLKDSGKLIIESPSPFSEKVLRKVHPSYWQESGHIRLIDERLIAEVISRLGFKLLKRQKKKGAENYLYLYYFFTGRVISSQTGDIDRENMFLRRLALLFSEDYFQTRLFREFAWFWFLCPIWLLTLPLGRIASLIFPKSIRYEFVLGKTSTGLVNKEFGAWPLVSIIVLNWNGMQDTIECLTSLAKVNYANFNVILVDNGSTDGSVKAIKRSFPDAILLQNKTNLGFAAGNNQGIRAAIDRGADYVLLLNNDTVVKPDFLTNLVQVAASKPNIGLVGPKIHFYRTKTLWYGGGFINQLTGFTSHRGEGQLDVGQFESEADVDFVSGCAMLVKQKVFERIGFLDEAYYHSHEDSDFCWRAKQAGYQIVYVPTAVIEHKLAVASGGRRSPFYLYYRTRNHLLFQRKQRLKAPLFMPIFIFLVIKRVVGSIMYGQPKGALATLRGIWDFYRGNWGKGRGDAFR
ncbi:hypothetical protein COT42_03775 [Candidatus Saganbacteria bacterium CG08_land_8_20_14_0_20_45_16]|uniref:Glycosyltransferase 2-like domain-containing protein n=1 Tax=Candidatus Saganbacteria bacterium CG08_land_8_20_14_0_20_45_16 TaxID=2014293 RepID=A0A2H0XYI0_UNCSA|nr:MAG: hypothetical protein COT42_03775 [Candidatus Saganbacteria bacterium CG08_land_8_20_14_0_20_45_16]